MSVPTAFQPPEVWAVFVTRTNAEDRELTADFALPGLWSGKYVLSELGGKPAVIAEGRIALPMAPETVQILSLDRGKVEH